MTNPRGWLPGAAILLCAALNAAALPPKIVPPAPTARITWAEVDDTGHGEVQATVKYVVRAPRGSKVTVQRLKISGEDVTPTPSTPNEMKDVGTLVLIDAGEPGNVHLSQKVAEWVKVLAAKRPDWNYRFIAGDHNTCLLSPLITNPKEQSDFRKDLASNPAQALALKSGIPIAEVMPQMVDLFSSDAHTLLVVAPQPPSWLPREVTEWMTRDLALGERKSRGLREQFRVRAGDAEAIHEIAEWIRLGHLHIAIVSDDLAQPQRNDPTTKQTTQKLPSPVVPPQASSPVLLRHGVEDILTGQKPPESPDQLIDQLSPALVEYRGNAMAPVSELQRLASGPYTAELEIAVDDVSFWTREVPLLDRAIRNWSPKLLQKYVIYIPAASVGILLLILLVEGVRKKKGLFDHDFPQKSRNCIFACAAVAFAIASNLTTNTTSRLQYLACCAALISGGVLVAVGVLYWIAYESRRKTAEDMPALSENNV